MVKEEVLSSFRPQNIKSIKDTGKKCSVDIRKNWRAFLSSFRPHNLIGMSLGDCNATEEFCNHLVFLNFSVVFYFEHLKLSCFPKPVQK